MDFASWGGATVFSAILSAIKWYCLGRLHISWFFGCREWHLLGLLFFLSVPVVVSRLLASPAPSLGYVSLKETPGTYCYVVAQIPRSPTGMTSFLQLSESSYCFRLHYMFYI